MKKSIQRMYVLLFCSLVLASACKKNELLPVNPPEAETMLQSSSVAVNGTNVAVIGEPNALLYISEPLFQEMDRGNYIEVVEAAPTKYDAIGVIKRPGGTEPPYDPCVKMWQDIDAHLAIYGGIYQAWADQHCQTYRFCWCDADCGKCVIIPIKPTVICGVTAYHNPVEVYDRN